MKKNQLFDFVIIFFWRHVADSMCRREPWDNLTDDGRVCAGRRKSRKDGRLSAFDQVWPGSEKSTRPRHRRVDVFSMPVFTGPRNERSRVSSPLKFQCFCSGKWKMMRLSYYEGVVLLNRSFCLKLSSLLCDKDTNPYIFHFQSHGLYLFRVLHDFVMKDRTMHAWHAAHDVHDVCMTCDDIPPDLSVCVSGKCGKSKKRNRFWPSRRRFPYPLSPPSSSPPPPFPSCPFSLFSLIGTSPHSRLCKKQPPIIKS